ncbi:unnamed protein product [Nippostrongylus brasiliensis]|uniref:Non-structural maintenance of chromosomes element 4 n=1 Tax=Nippostrongylus brasiliensis TaxID=27835 RepID=A0A0N4YZ96_NIPBR|nr:unnamed protein product [Nippostrongylus brasiliensis]
MRKPDGKNHPRQRRSSELMDIKNSPKKRRSSETSNVTIPHDRPFSPATLARKLDLLREDILADAVGQLSAVELRGFDKEIETEEEYMRRREEVRRQTSNPEAFDTNGRTELNYDAAAVAGAKLLIDETRATRSMCKKLLENCGIDEDEILYKPLSYDEGTEFQSAKHLANSRQASVVESMVDFQKQIKLKSEVLSCVVLRNNGMRMNLRIFSFGRAFDSSFSRRGGALLENCGIDEDEILYKPLSYDEGTEFQSAKHLANSRQASVVESMVDFQKQIKLKSEVLSCVVLRNNDGFSRSDGRLTRRSREEEERERQRANAKVAGNSKPKVMRTPSKNPQFDPLDEKKIIERYALEVASEVRENRKRRRIAPVPFDITLLDDIEYNFGGTV